MDVKIGITERGDAAIHFDEWRAKADTVDGIILITKDPQALLDRSSEIPWGKCIVHCTITGWGNTKLEPGVLPVRNAVWGYKELLAVHGPEKVVLRIDPVIPTMRGVGRALRVAAYAEGRIRISFLDFYRHTQSRLRKAGQDELLQELLTLFGRGLHAPLRLRQQYAELFSKDIEICGEPGMDCSGCVSLRDIQAISLEPPETLAVSGQRRDCACLTVKTELLSHRKRCKHGCLYCYWR